PAFQGVGQRLGTEIESSKDEAATAALKTVELDAVLGGRTPEEETFETRLYQFNGANSNLQERALEVLQYLKVMGDPTVTLETTPGKSAEEFLLDENRPKDVALLDDGRVVEEETMETRLYQFNGANSNLGAERSAEEMLLNENRPK
uniref:Villin-like protein ABP41 (Fragments) n=1 Tax=Lilium davidii TaxID=82316 RepID=ABP41_LILDA|nr:RecName: Full=Villin-like protein ABP41; AltName: Full=Calcium-dependent actin-binding protein ABP41 [Lilium davidii]